MDSRDPASPRPPSQIDLVALCRELNSKGALYLVVGGMAINQLGLVRATEDIDLLIESSEPNLHRVCIALEFLPDRAVLELTAEDFKKYTVIRVADEIVVDLMQAACGIRYEEAQAGIERRVINGVAIPFASAELLLRMKRTHREKDVADRLFLEEKIRREKAR